jgi:flagellar motor switch protein FliM
MNLCFPTFALEDILTQLNRQQLTTSAKFTNERQKENMPNLEATTIIAYLFACSSTVGKASIGVGELLELKVGDILKLNTRINQEIEVIIAGRRKLAARPGAVDGKKIRKNYAQSSAR